LDIYYKLDMPVLLHQQPVLTLALDSFQDTTIDENDIRR